MPKLIKRLQPTPAPTPTKRRLPSITSPLAASTLTRPTKPAKPSKLPTYTKLTTTEADYLDDGTDVPDDSLIHSPATAPAPAPTPRHKPNNSSDPLSHSPLSIAFRHIQPTWRAYLNYVKIGSLNRHPILTKVWTCYSKLSLKEQSQVLPEQLCDFAGITPADLIGAVTSQLWQASANEATMITAINHPGIVAANLQQAATPKGFKDREMHFKSNGLLGSLPTNPSPGPSTVIYNTAHAQANSASISSSGPTLQLPSMEDAVLAFEARHPNLVTAKPQSQLPQAIDVDSTRQD